MSTPQQILQPNQITMWLSSFHTSLHDTVTAVECLVHANVRKLDILRLPTEHALTVMTLLKSAQSRPAAHWSSEAFHLVGREDLAALVEIKPRNRRAQDSSQDVGPFLLTIDFI